MKTAAAIAVSAVLLFGCAETQVKPTPVVKQNSVKTQQALASQAEAEMDTDIQNGTVTLTEPVLKPTVVKEEPKQQPIPQNNVVTLSSLKPTTKYPLKNGYPVWFYQNIYDGYIGAVGIAPKQPNGSLTQQKKVAKMLAQKNLAQQIEVLIHSELNVESTNVDTATVKYYQQKVTSLSKESAEQFLTGYRVQDEWIDEKTGEYYVWMILEK